MKKVWYFGWTLSLLGFLGCQKTVDQFTEDEVTLPDVQWVAEADSLSEVSRMYSQMEPRLLTRNIVYNGDQDTNIELDDHIEVILPARTFEYNGAILTNVAIRIEIIILKKKGEWIRARKSTAAISGKLLESHGIILARAWYNGELLSVRYGGGVKFRYRFAGADKEMKYYQPGLSNIAIHPYYFNWMQGDVGMVTYLELPGSTNTNPLTGYMVESKRLGWMSVAKPAHVSDRSAIVTAGLPDGFQNRNTHVYLVFLKKASLLGMNPDQNNRIWFNRIVPLQEPFMVVTITRQDGRYYLGTARTGEDGISENKHFAIRPRAVSLDELLKFLNNL